MITPEDFVANWGEHDLTRFPNSLFESLSIPEISKVFLVQAGLPKRIPIFTGAEYELLPISPNSQQNNSVTQFRLLQRLRESPYLMLGYLTSASYLCICDNKGNLGMLGEPNLSFVFMNSNVPMFAESLLLYRSLVETAQHGEEVSRAVILRMRQQLKRIDPHAFDNESYYWPLVIEDFLMQI